jgi:small conductance mechanosensitive channel
MEPRSLADIGRHVAERVVEHAPGILGGLALLALFWLLAGLAARLLRRVFTRADSDPALANLAVPLVRLSILLLGFLAAIEQMGVNVGSLVAGVGVVGLAIGLAAQETLANLVGGFVLLWDRPFRLGDSVTIGGFSGAVTEIGLRSTRLRTLDQREVTIPNKDVAQQKVVNHSRYPRIRIDAPFFVGYRESVPRVRELVLAAIVGNADVLGDPPPQVVVIALADWAIALELRLWVANPAGESATLFRFLELVQATLAQAGIETPFPQRPTPAPEPRAAREEGVPR